MLFRSGRIKTVFNSKKVTDHHAIIPTISSLKEDVSELPPSEAKVYFAARTLALQLHPEVGDMLARKKDTGRADAICIAHFGGKTL